MFNKYTIKAINFATDLLPLSYTRENLDYKRPTKSTLFRQDILKRVEEATDWIRAEDFGRNPVQTGQIKTTMEYLEWCGRLFKGPDDTYGNSYVFEKWKDDQKTKDISYSRVQQAIK